jgi:outer membrane protein assembly factor BamB
MLTSTPTVVTTTTAPTPSTGGSALVPLWRVAFPWAEHGAAVAADQKRSYFRADDDAVSVMAVDLADGHVVWNEALSSDTLRTNGSGFAITSAGLLAFWEHEDGSHLDLIEPTTGKVVWTRDLDGGDYTMHGEAMPGVEVIRSEDDDSYSFVRLRDGHVVDAPEVWFGLGTGIATPRPRALVIGNRFDAAAVTLRLPFETATAADATPDGQLVVVTDGKTVVGMKGSEVAWHLDPGMAVGDVVVEGNVLVLQNTDDQSPRLVFGRYDDHSAHIVGEAPSGFDAYDSIATGNGMSRSSGKSVRRSRS